MTGQRFSAADFMDHAPRATNGSSAWSSRYAGTVKSIVISYAHRAPRTLQRHLGPSEIGVECDLQVVGKLLDLPRTNHVADPWPSIVGTAVHAWLADCFSDYNTTSGQLRFLTEQRVTPIEGHSGTGDLYDAVEQIVGDHKVLGERSLAKVRSIGGPPRKYVVQLLLYALGFRRLGLPVTRVALIAYPRTAGSLDQLYVWDRVAGPDDAALLAEVLTELEHRKQLAAAIAEGRALLADVERTPDAYECYFCPLYRPESAKDGGPGCPGTVESS